MLYRGKHVFINGESFSAGPADKKVLNILANTRRLSSDEVKIASTDVKEALHSWHGEGWLHLLE